MSSFIFLAREMISPKSVSTEKTYAQGFIFLCSDETQEECLALWLFGSPHKAIHDMERNIGRSTKLFLFNVSSRCIYGPYYAAAKPQLQINRTAFGSRFPAQVQVRPYGQDREMDARRLSWKPKSGSLSANHMSELRALWDTVAQPSTQPAVVKTEKKPSRTTDVTSDVKARDCTTSAAAPKPSWADDCESESHGGDSEEGTPTSFTTAASTEAGEPSEESLALKIEAIVEAVAQRQADLQSESSVLGQIRADMSQLNVSFRLLLEPCEQQVYETDGSIAELDREFERVTKEFKQRKEALREKRALLMDNMEAVTRRAEKERDEKVNAAILTLREEGIALSTAGL